MARKAGPADEDYASAARLGLLGLMAGQHSDTIMEQLEALHPRNNTFPAEDLLELAAEAIEESGAAPAEPIPYEGVRDRYLPEYHFRRQVPAAQQPLRTHGCGHDSGRASTPTSLTRRMGGALTTCGSTPSTPWCSTAGWRPSGPDEHLRTSHRLGRASGHRPGELVTARHEGHHHIRGMAVEVLAAAVIDGGRPRIRRGGRRSGHHAGAPPRRALP